MAAVSFHTRAMNSAGPMQARNRDRVANGFVTDYRGGRTNHAWLAVNNKRESP